MFDVSKFLDRAKAGAGISSDYALAKIIGVGHPRVSNWRRGENAPDERAILALCQLSGDDPEHVAACIQAMRAANDDAAALWERVARRLAGGANVILAAVAAIVLLAPSQDGALAATLCPAGGECPSVYYVKWFSAVILTRFAWRVAALMRRKGVFSSARETRPLH